MAVKSGVGQKPVSNPVIWSQWVSGLGLLAAPFSALQLTPPEPKQKVEAGLPFLHKVRPWQPILIKYK